MCNKASRLERVILLLKAQFLNSINNKLCAAKLMRESAQLSSISDKSLSLLSLSEDESLARALLS